MDASYTTSVVTTTPNPPPPLPRKRIRTRRQAALDEGNAARERVLPEYWARVGKYLAYPHNSDARFLKCEAPFQHACVDDVSSEDVVAVYADRFKFRCHKCAPDLIAAAAEAYADDADVLAYWGGARVVATANRREHAAALRRIKRAEEKHGREFTKFTKFGIDGGTYIFIEPDSPDCIGGELVARGLDDLRDDAFTVLNRLYLTVIKPFGSKLNTSRALRQRLLDESMAEPDDVRLPALIEEEAASETRGGVASLNPDDFTPPTDQDLQDQADEEEQLEEYRIGEERRAEAEAVKEAHYQRQFDALPADAQRYFRRVQQGIRPTKVTLWSNWVDIARSLGARAATCGRLTIYLVPRERWKDFNRVGTYRKGAADVPDCTDAIN